MTTSNDLLRASATELAGLLRAGDVSATELTTDALERIEDMNSDLNAICHLAADEALEAAAAADRQLATGDPADLPAFFGVPTLIKELSFVEGWPVCGASLAVDYPPASTDEVVVARWRDAGFVFLGSSTSPEFGALATTESLRHGATRNPWDLSRVSGGSS
ncbi:MAG: amidase, partial [Glaciecola sp.]